MPFENAVARDLLQTIEQRTRLAGHNRLALLLFRLGGRQVFGVNVFKVQEVLRCPPLRPVPAAHPLVRGVADVRGRTLPVLDLGRAIGHPESAIDPQAAYAVVAEFNRSVQGFLVSAVERIVNVAVEQVQPPPQLGSEDGYLTAVTHCNGELVEIVDLEKVLAEVASSAPEVSAAVLERSHGHGRHRVLVVDDSRVARAQIQHVIERLGLEATIMTDGREALGHLQALVAQGLDPARHYALVISDIEMPHMDGYTLTTEIRRDPRLGALYVLLHTSLSGIFNNAMVERVGANKFVSKYSPDELARAILDRVEAVEAQEKLAA